jgi:hypothetical protein
MHDYDRRPQQDRTATHKSVVGPFTKQHYTAAWAPLLHLSLDEQRGVYAGPDGLPGCWTYQDERHYGPSLGTADNRHATPEAALESAVERDVYSAAQGGPLTREEYEAEIKRLHLHQMWKDRDCAAIMGGDWDFKTYGVKGAAERILAGRRGAAVKEESQKSAPNNDDRVALEMEIADLEEQAQDAEDREQLGRASALRAKARALRSRTHG